jgi:hypothetical protein
MSRLLAAFATLALTAPSALAATSSKPVDLDVDRARAQQASSIVQADERFISLQQQRVDALKSAWDEAVRQGHPNEAGQLAVAHWNALRIEIRARVALEHARRDFSIARENLIADEFAIQQG